MFNKNNTLHNIFHSQGYISLQICIPILIDYCILNNVNKYVRNVIKFKLE